MNSRIAATGLLSAYLLLGFTGNASFVIYHIHTHHRQVGTYDDAATARRGERLRTFMAQHADTAICACGALRGSASQAQGPLPPFLGETN
jgi:hypothetical protein